MLKIYPRCASAVKFAFSGHRCLALFLAGGAADDADQPSGLIADATAVYGGRDRWVLCHWIHMIELVAERSDEMRRRTRTNGMGPRVLPDLADELLRRRDEDQRARKALISVFRQRQ